MAVTACPPQESLPGSQFWERFLLLFAEPKLRSQSPWVRAGVPFRKVVAFTVVQLAALGGIYALTWAGIAGIFFPIPLMLLVPVRAHLLPRVFGKEAVDVLDSDTVTATVDGSRVDVYGDEPNRLLRSEGVVTVPAPSCGDVVTHVPSTHHSHPENEPTETWHAAAHISHGTLTHRVHQ